MLDEVTLIRPSATFSLEGEGKMGAIYTGTRND